MKLFPAPFAFALKSLRPLFAKPAEPRCHALSASDLPSHYTELMPEKMSTATVTSATHRLTLEIAKPPTVVWEGFTRELQAWWPKDFYATESPRRMVFEVKPGGRLYEDAGNGNGLVWYQVIALDAPRALTLAGFIAPPFGGPATSLLRVEFSANGQAGTLMEVTDSTFGCLDESTTAEGWRTLFEDGFKAWIESQP